MKTLSSLAEYDDVLSSNDGGVVVSCLPSKIEDNQRGQANIFDCRSQGDNENKQKPENLIICDSNLASTLHNVKSDKRITSGHYLQKLLFNYSGTQTVRSQSLPNCVEDEKHLNNSPEENCNSNFLKIHSSHDSTENGENSLNCIPNESSHTELNGCNNETWFKTWPERGSDKRQTLYNENSNKNVNLSAVVENNNEEICVQHTQKQELQKQNVIPAATVSVSPGSNNVLVCNNSPVHLNLALESIPSLGYSPVTKQLHVIQPVTASKIESHNKSVRPKDIAVISNGNNVIGCGRNESTNDLKSFNVGSDTTSTTPSTCVTKTVNNSSSNNPSLSRVPTETSCCSYSSTVSSLSSDVSLSGGTNDDSALGGSLLGLDHGDSCSLASIGECSILSEDSVAGTGAAASTASCAASGNAKLKKKSLSGFFSRNVFGWKSSSGGTVDDGADLPSQQRHQQWLGSSGNNSGISSGWKLFSSNKINNSSLNTTSSYSGHSGYESGSATPGSPCSVRSSSSGGGGSKIRSGHDNVIASSTTALIQLDRPSCLPAKTQEELEKHRQEYQDIVDAARKKELKEAKHRKRQLQIQLRIEEQQAQAARVWNQEILPKWDTMCNSRKTQELWWLGVPPCVRGKVWRLAITNELNLTQQLFDICCLRAHDMLNTVDICNTECESTDNKEASVQLIQLDISRTFPNLCIFQQGGPYYDMLHRLLAAYVCYRPDVGYVQGMSFIAAVLILNMDVSDAFTCFANLLNRPLHMAFFSLNQSLMQAYYATYNDLFSENLPRVYKHFVNSNLTADLYLLDWIYTVFTKAMNLDLASRVWDVFLRDGESFLFRAALGILHLCQDSLLKMDFIHGSQYLTRLPDDLPSDQLFKSIATIKMNVGKQTFEQILAFHLQQQQDSVNNH